ncbi:MAG TPA: hypothetical protein GXZ48_03325 [Acholeplasmataceae bacterium]|nr:hypothetical protein [Acholeplasmataceae bacterium]
MRLKLFQFKPLGKITEIPNSQSIFGMICYAYSEKYGQVELEAMLARFYNGNPDFIISSFFLHDLLPMPLDISHYHPNLSKEKLIKLKNAKKIKYISKSIFQEYLNNLDDFNKKYYENIFNNNYVIVNNEYLVKREEQKKFENYIFKEEMHIRNYVDEKELFYNNCKYYHKDVAFDLYVKINNDEEKITNLLKDLHYVSIGGGKSIGYNLFSVIDNSEIEFVNHKENKILLSMATVSDEIDYEKSYYKLETLHNKFNNAINRVYKNCVTVFKAGSTLNTTKDVIGSFLKNDIDGKTKYSNYLGLLI